MVLQFYITAFVTHCLQYLLLKPWILLNTKLFVVIPTSIPCSFGLVLELVQFELLYMMY